MRAQAGRSAHRPQALRPSSARPASKRRHVVLQSSSSSLDSVSLFADNSLMGPSTSEAEASKSSAVALMDVPLTSEVRAHQVAGNAASCQRGARDANDGAPQILAPMHDTRSRGCAQHVPRPTRHPPHPLVPAPSVAVQLGVDYTKLRDHLAAGEWREAEDEHRAVLIRMAGPEAERRGWVYFSEVKTIPATDMQTLDSLWLSASKGKFGFSVQKEIWLQVWWGVQAQGRGGGGGGG